MGRKTTPGRGTAALVLLVCAAAACGDGSDPDPRVVAAALDAERAKVPSGWDRPTVVVAETAPSQPPPGPTAETSVRDGVPVRRTTSIAVGRNAAHVVDPTVERAVAEACPEFDAKYSRCSDRDAVELLMVGRADFGVIGGPLSPRELEGGLRQTRIGIELFALAVAESLPVRSLSRAQVRQVLTGQVTRWAQLGYEGGDITVLAYHDRSLAERAARALIPGGNFAATALRMESEGQVTARLLQDGNAVGIVHVLDEPLDAGLKLLQIDWIAATAENFGYESYPFGEPVHLVTSGQPTGDALKFLEHARSEAGRTLLQRSLLTR
ncbi:MAG TPA: substrate-binding domain-containing protein [Planctomycetota bacterium]